MIGPKLKNCLFPAPDQPLENVATRNIFWVICDDFFFLVTGNRDRKFRYCSRIYVRNWFTLLNEQNPLLDFEGTRFVSELWKKKKSPYLHVPTHRWNGGSGAGNEHIFKGGLVDIFFTPFDPWYLKNHWSFFLCSLWSFLYQKPNNKEKSCRIFCQKAAQKKPYQNWTITGNAEHSMIQQSINNPLR